jgi:hypothetical protein
MLQLVPQVLTWHPAVALHSHVIAGHRALLEKEYEERLSLFVKAGIGTRACQMTRWLPDSSLDRFLTAPETADRLLHRPRTQFSYFLDALIAECRLVGNWIDSSELIWTALFDYCFPAVQDRNGILNMVAARRLSNGIPIDLVSPQAETAYFGLPIDSIRLTESEADFAIDRLDLALHAIAKLNGPAAEMIQRYVKVIILRKHAEGEVLYSCSYDHFPGKMGLLNAQAAGINLCRLMNAVLHEAVHSFLYVLEEGRAFFWDEDVGNKLQLQSPWSGRSLRLHSFVHACYVWFGLWQFWKLAETQKPYTSPDAQIMLERARIGFFKPEMADRIYSLSRYLTRHGKLVIDLIDDIRRGKYA